MDTLNNIHKLLHKTSEVRLKMPMSILERNNKEQQQALENLKQDPTVEVIEDEEKIEVNSFDGIKTISHYKIITIKPKRSG